MKLQTIIESHWYSKFDPIIGVVMFPFSLIYELIVKIRWLLFKLGLKRSTKLPVPVVIIGNISVGGVGKTPLTKMLANELKLRGINTGIILRGYKGSSKNARIVTAQDDTSLVGDEALIYAQAGFKVAIGSKRVEAAKLLLATYPEIQLILADDGMQHYYLKRDLEICVIDSSRILGNQQVLPLGPLREPMSRLKTIDYFAINGKHNQEQLNKILTKYKKPVVYQELRFINFYNPVLDKTATIEELNKIGELLPMAAIGNPQRFYYFLKDLGVSFRKVKSLPDHHDYVINDIPDDYTIITTEKDYTKLAKFKNKRIWVANVSAELSDESLINKIISLIKINKDQG